MTYYATLMGEVWKFSADEWRAVLLDIADGSDPGATVEYFGERLGPVENVTDWTPEDARMQLEPHGTLTGTPEARADIARAEGEDR